VNITIDSEVNEVDEFSESGYLTSLALEDGREYYVARNSEEAGKAARRYWVDQAYDNPGEFCCIVGKENLLKWALGDCAGPGRAKVRSLQEWFDLYLDVPEEEWAGYDGEEVKVKADEELIVTLGFEPTVAYRAQ